MSSRPFTLALASSILLLVALTATPARSADLPPTTAAAQPTATAAQPAAAPAQVVQAAPVAVAAVDPYGFTNWLNNTRAQYGLPPVGFDPNLSSWANVNNGQQQARGMGHHVMGPARRQNSGMGDMSAVSLMWMASPAHRSALLDPSIRWIGIAGLGAYWTFNAY
ncbi:CAP domain-containing protein [Tundrisphaera sp. TA3]|uniref:CAP domain-containing protein n=1 Tax=Tundrisphaera sp. TA3 TaxID=3435775 RepID=UPI003EBD5C2D